MGSIPELGRSPGGGRGTPLQYSCLENPTNRGAWQATVPGVAQSRARLKRPSIATAAWIWGSSGRKRDPQRDQRRKSSRRKAKIGFGGGPCVRIKQRFNFQGSVKSKCEFSSVQSLSRV